MGELLLVAIFLLLPACVPSLEVTPTPSVQPVPTSRPAVTSTPTAVPPTDTPDWCIGWWCALSGVVYAGTAGPGNELEGVLVQLSHTSYCSPTRGQHEGRTGPDGRFQFDVFVHDTDTFWFEVQLDGYESVEQRIGGFDCLYCSCPAVEIVLPFSGTSTSSP